MSITGRNPFELVTIPGTQIYGLDSPDGEKSAPKVNDELDRYLLDLRSRGKAIPLKVGTFYARTSDYFVGSIARPVLELTDRLPEGFTDSYVPGGEYALLEIDNWVGIREGMGDPDEFGKFMAQSALELEEMVEQANIRRLDGYRPTIEAYNRLDQPVTYLGRFGLRGYGLAILAPV